MMNRSVSSVALGIAALLAAAGCNDRSSPATKAIESGSRDVHAISYGVTEAATEGVRDKTFGKVAGDVGAATGSASAGEKGAGAVLVALAQASLGDTAAAEAAGFQRAALNSISQVEAQLSQWRMRSAVAAAADGFDPSKQLAEIAKSKSEKDGEIKKEQDHRAQVQAQLTDLQGKAKAKLDGAAAKENAYAQKMQQAVKLSATDAAPIVQAANVTKREADALRLEGTKFEAQAQTVAPLITEIDAIIAQLTAQKKDLTATEAALAQATSASKAEASEARAGATAANVEIEKGVDAVAKQHSEQIEPAIAKALESYSKASAAAKDASQQAPTSGKATQGDIQVSIAGVHWQKAQALKAFAHMLETLSAAEPALPKRGEYTEKAKTARESAKQELEAAANALDSAKSAFGGAGGRMPPEAKERLAKLGELLDKAMAVTKDDGQTASADLQALTGRGGATPPAEKPAEAGPAPAAAAAGAPADPALVAAIDAFLTAGREGRSSDILAMTYFPESAKAAVEPMKDIAAKMDKVDKAFRSKFGKSFQEAAAANPMLGAMVSQMAQVGGVDPAKLKTLKAADLTVAVNGDTGSASGGGLAKALQFKKVDGKWLYFDPNMEAAGPMLGAQAAALAPISKGFDEFAGEVESGKYPDANAAMTAFLAKMQAMMMGGGGTPGGGKKGGGGGGGG